MKKVILIGFVGVLLAVLALFGWKQFLGGKEADGASDSAEVLAETDVSSGDAESVAAESADATVETDVSDEMSDDTAPDGTEESSEGDANAGDQQAAEDTAEDATEEVAASSDENTLFSIQTSDGNYLGMAPIVGGNAVILMGTDGTVYQGDYAPPKEKSAFQIKLEEQTALAASEGKVAAWTFYRESEMNDFAFPEGVGAIEKFAFARSGLTGIVIPEGVTSIGSGAFYHCDSLSDVTIPDSVTVIEENAFSHTPWLDNWLAGGAGGEAGEEAAEASAASDTGDFLIVGDGILLAYRGSEANPELPPEVKSVAPGALGE